MAKTKAPKPLTEAPPEPDSSDDDSSSTEIEDSQDLHETQLPSNDHDASSSSSSSDDDDDKPIIKTPAKKTTNSSSDDEDDDDDDVTNTTPLNTKQKSISLASTTPTKSATTPTTKPRSRPNVVGLTSEKPEKRALDGDDTKEKAAPSSKKAKKEKTTTTTAITEEGAKKQSVPFQRLFSDNDEVVILKGMIDYKSRKGVDPMIDAEDFYGFIKGSMACDVNRNQFVDKVRRLRKKYLNASKKKKTPSNPHDAKLFELGKKIWGAEVVENEVDEKSAGSNGVVTVAVGAGEKSKGKVVKSKSVVAGAGEEDGEGKEWKIAECEAMEVEVGEDAARERVRKKGLKLMGAKARGELAEMWDKVAVAQREVDEMRYEVLKEESKRIVEALKSAKA